MPACDPDLSPFAASGTMTPMTPAEIASGFGQCSDPRPTTGRLNWVLNWLTCQIGALSPCDADAATPAQIAAMTSDTPILTCIGGAPVSVPASALPFATDADIAVLNPCSALAADSGDVALMAANPASIRVSVCHDDGTPSVKSINGAELVDIIGGASSASWGSLNMPLVVPQGPIAFNYSTDGNDPAVTGWPSTFTVPAGVTHVVVHTQNGTLQGDVTGQESHRVYPVNVGDVVAFNSAGSPTLNGANGVLYGNNPVAAIVPQFGASHVFPSGVYGERSTFLVYGATLQT